MPALGDTLRRAAQQNTVGGVPAVGAGLDQFGAPALASPATDFLIRARPQKNFLATSAPATDARVTASIASSSGAGSGTTSSTETLDEISEARQELKNAPASNTQIDPSFGHADVAVSIDHVLRAFLLLRARNLRDRSGGRVSGSPLYRSPDDVIACATAASQRDKAAQLQRLRRYAR